MLLITLSVWITLRVIQALHIDVISADSIQFAGNTVTKENLHTFLETHELELLFGKDFKDTQQFTLAHVLLPKRSRRSVVSAYKTLQVKLDHENANDMHFALRRSKRLIDESFVFIKRFANSSILLDDFHKLGRQLEPCFYRTEHSAIDLCDDSIRGILRLHNKSFAIHPLPERFGQTAHVLVNTESFTINHHANSVYPTPPSDGVVRRSSQQKQHTCAVGQDVNLNENESQRATSFNQISNNLQSLLGHRRHNSRTKRFISGTNKVPRVLHIETAIFVDKDLYRHMSKNYPKDTESRLMRFVLAMINGVQLLYHHPSLGHEINFVLKRLEILHNDPKGLQRSSDIDVFLNSFCLWQRKFNPVSDADAVHFDHAVILTGLDLYVQGKNGKISSQVVGLAPVSGMCTATSSCTINEGKHFESVFVVAHEIGHNLGMRHDASENGCDPSLYIMSPTLGSGKITWSKCSRDYLQEFLGSHQSKCLFDRGHFGTSLDHAAEGLLPGERFDADQQCLLKYGKNSVRSKTQEMSEVCRDLHCQRDRYTWTSHPSLEGTKCGEEMWCRAGSCVMKNESRQANSLPIVQSEPSSSAIVSSVKLENDMHVVSPMSSHPTEIMLPIWSDWGPASECESGCLFGESGRLREGSTGLRTIARTCLHNRKRCLDQDRKYESCSSKQCYNVPRTTVLDFANQICDRAQKFDQELLPNGVQEIGANPYESCKVYCRTKSGVPKSKSWIYPDGTTCRTKDTAPGDLFYCVNGKCEKFTCDNSSSNFFRADQLVCPSLTSQHPNSVGEKGVRDLKSMSMRVQIEKLIDAASEEATPMSTRRPATQSNYNGFRHKSDISDHWRYKGYAHSQDATNLKPLPNRWKVRSGCHFGCMEYSKGIQIVGSSIDNSTNIQLCEPEVIACDRLQSASEFANKLCHRYQQKVRGLSGGGMQILPSAEDPDRGCKVACQDERLRHRFYLVNGDRGYFPFGTRCARSENRYCVNGKCLEFGLDNVPLNESHISLALYRNKREENERKSDDDYPKPNHRVKRNFIYYNPINITEHVDTQFLRHIVDQLSVPYTYYDWPVLEEHIDFLNPVHVDGYY